MMRARSALVVVASCLLAASASAQPVNSAFLYQGELKIDGAPANGTYHFVFTLFPTDTSTSPVSLPLCADNVPVVNGRFAITLAGAVFPGDQRWLDIQVRDGAAGDCANTAGYSTLSPRQPLLATPHASFAINSRDATNAINAQTAARLGGQLPSFYQNASNLTSGTIADTRLSTNVPRLSSPNTFTADITAPAFSGSGAALTALNATNVSTGTLADARLSSNIPRLNSGATTFTGTLAASSFSGSGASLTALNATNVTTGTLADARLSSNIPRLSANNSFTGANSFTDSVGIGTSVPEGSLHVRSADSLGTIIVTPGVTDTQSQLVMAENTTVSNAFILRYNGTTNNLEFRGRAADVETEALLTVNRDSATATLGNAVEPGRLNINGGPVALSVSSTTPGDGAVVLPANSIGPSELFAEPSISSGAGGSAVALVEDSTTTADSHNFSVDAPGFALAISTFQVNNNDVFDATFEVLITNSASASASGAPRTTVRAGASATITVHTIFAVNPGVGTAYLRVRSSNANTTASNVRTTTVVFAN